MGGHKKAVDIVPGYAKVKGYFHFVQERKKKERVDKLIFLPYPVFGVFEPQAFTILIGMNKKEAANPGLFKFFMHRFEAHGRIGGLSSTSFHWFLVSGFRSYEFYLHKTIYRPRCFFSSRERPVCLPSVLSVSS